MITRRGKLSTICPRSTTGDAAKMISSYGCGRECPRSHVLVRLPHLDKLNLQGRSTKVLWEQREDLVDTCCRRRLDRLDTSFVRRLANLLRERMARPDQVGRAETRCRENRNVTQIEDLVEVRRHGPQLTRQEILDLDALPYCLAHELRDHAGPGEAQVDDREAPGRVVPTAESPSAFTAARVEAGRCCALASVLGGAIVKRTLSGWAGAPGARRRRR